MQKLFRLQSKGSSATSSQTSFSGSSSGEGSSTSTTHASHVSTATYNGNSNPSPKIGIFLVGATYLDTIMHVNSFPHEDMKQRSERFEQRRGGNAANTAEILGQDPRAKVWYMSSMPAPAAAKILLTALERNNVKTEACVFHSAQLTAPQAYIISAKDTGSRTVISHSTLPDLTLEEFIKRFDAARMRAVPDIVDMSCPFNWIHFEGRGPDVYKMINYVESIYIKQRWRQKLTISVEFEKGDRPGIPYLLKQADVCFFSKLYAQTLGFDRPEDFLASIKEFCKPTATLFCCWGAMGAVGLHLETGTRFSSSAGTVDRVVDPVGAGDTFIAGIILALGVRGYDIGRGLQFACELASQKCAQYGFSHLLKSIPPDL